MCNVNIPSLAWNNLKSLGSSQGKHGIPIFEGIGKGSTNHSSGSTSYWSRAYFTSFKPSVIDF